MNYLAHFFLSFDEPEVVMGNFLGDFVTKTQYNELPSKIKKGVNLHREIDLLMDTHEISRSSKEKFSNHRHYSRVIIDVVYDHFLAKNWKTFSNIDLLEATHNYYQMIDHQQQWLNPKAAQYFYYMKKRNWILSYPTVEGINQILQSMARRTPYVTTMNTAIEELIQHYDDLEREFSLFFPIINDFSKGYLGKKP